MDFNLLIFGIFLLITTIISIATASIAIQCYNACDKPDMNAEHPRNKTFLVINLVLSIGMVFASFYICKVAVMPSINFGGMGMGGGMGGMGMGGGMGGMGGGINESLSRLF